mgnify:CR=1 FL=1
MVKYMVLVQYAKEQIIFAPTGITKGLDTPDNFMLRTLHCHIVYKFKLSFLVLFGK